MGKEKVVSVEEKVKHFEKELELIFDKSIREFTRLCIIFSPDYIFYDCPASSTGKYHPLDEICALGTIIHTKRVFTVAYELCRGLACEDNRDAILSACLIHDLRKQGLTKTNHTAKNHPELAAKLVEEVQADTQLLNTDAYNIIRNSVGYHYGPWSSGAWVKPLSEYTPEELCVYLSDYIASKKVTHVDYRR